MSDEEGKQSECQINLARDMELIDEALADRPAIRMVFIDPVSEYLGGVDSHKNAEVRSVLAPLSRTAERRGVAIVNVTHFNKAGFGPAMYRAMGLIGLPRRLELRGLSLKTVMTRGESSCSR